MNFAPNADEALHFRKICTLSDRRWVRYAPAYVITNEPLRAEMAFMPKNCNNALTVAASGDHPFFCKLHGARHVTTFDITCNAKLMSDIKIAALHELNIGEYFDLLKSLHTAKNPLFVPNMNKIIPHLPAFVQKYMVDMTKHGFSLFSAGRGTESYIPRSLQTSDFQELKTLVNEPFDFIWSDAVDLQLTEHYDFIHLSNISDYLSYEKMGQVLINMINHTNVGGTIFAEQQNHPNAELLFPQVSEKLSNWKLLSRGRMNVLQRIR